MTQPLPLSDIEFLTEFAAYCRGRGDEAYDYTKADNCALTQFLRGTGRTDMLADDGCSEPEYCSPLDWALLRTPGTFSALAGRIDKLIPATVERVG